MASDPPDDDGPAPARPPRPSPAARAVMARAVRDILAALGEDPEREGLRDTPGRVARMYEEVLFGLHEDPAAHLGATFAEEPCEDWIAVRDVAFHSMCEHHLLPFFGRAHLAYRPAGGRIAGFGGLAGVVRTLAARPQLQERLTAQVADTVQDALAARGVLVVVEAEHLCMTMRGARAQGSAAVTTAARGALAEDPELRREAMALLRP